MFDGAFGVWEHRRMNEFSMISAESSIDSLAVVRPDELPVEFDRETGFNVDVSFLTRVALLGLGGKGGALDN